MKLCFLVDYRSPIARNWISYFVAQSHEVHVISSYPFSGPTTGISSIHCVPIGFAGFTERPELRQFAAASQSSSGNVNTAPSVLRRLGKSLGNVARGAQVRMSPLDVHRQKRRVRTIVESIGPDLVHAMRIPFEGILASLALADVKIPLLISVWGNDFTLFASRYSGVARATKGAMQRATALHADCQRDVRLAREWGLHTSKRAIVLPGGGGIQCELFRPSSPADALEMRVARERWGIPADAPVLFNPRNFRPSYVRNDTFFDAIPLVLAACPKSVFVCVGMKGNPIAEQRRADLDNPAALQLLPSVSRSEMAELFRIADVTVSPSVHDGTPNTLLEGMACGAFPVVGDVESLREWLTDGVNGLLCDPLNSQSLANAMIRAIEDRSLRERAMQINQPLIRQRAEHTRVMGEATAFYRQVMDDDAGVTGPYPQAAAC